MCRTYAINIRGDGNNWEFNKIQLRIDKPYTYKT